MHSPISLLMGLQSVSRVSCHQHPCARVLLHYLYQHVPEDVPFSGLAGSQRKWVLFQGSTFPLKARALEQDCLLSILLLNSTSRMTLGQCLKLSLHLSSPFRGLHKRALHSKDDSEDVSAYLEERHTHSTCCPSGFPSTLPLTLPKGSSVPQHRPRNLTPLRGPPCPTASAVGKALICS